MAFAWSGEGRRPIGGSEDSDRDHLPPVADRTFTLRFTGQFFVEIAVVGFVPPRDNPG